MNPPEYWYEGTVMDDMIFVADSGCAFSVESKNHDTYFMSEVQRYAMERDGTRGKKVGKPLELALFGKTGTEITIQYEFQNCYLGCLVSLFNLDGTEIAYSLRCPEFNGSSRSISGKISHFNEESGPVRSQHRLRIGNYQPTSGKHLDPNANITIKPRRIKQYAYKGVTHQWPEYKSEIPAQLTSSLTSAVSGKTGDLAHGVVDRRDFNIVRDVKYTKVLGRRRFKIISLSDSERRAVVKKELGDY